MDRSNFSRYALAAIVGVFLLSIFAYRQYEMSQRFDYFGVVEGFYGNPWTHEARLDMIRFMGDVGMNEYYYAPKDDPFHRQRWREPYSGEYLSRFQELVNVAEESGVTIWYAISPGLDMVYSSEEDYQALRSKLMDMTNLGVFHLALFLDDVPEYLQHEADKEQFANLAEAHVHIINRLYEDLREIGADLVVCPTTYTAAWGSREYIQILGQGIPREIRLFWTGYDIAPATISLEDARYWGALMSRKPLVWDNFPVNDFETWRPIMGPLDGRDGRLSRATTGFIANPMDAPYLSMIPLYTVADYARRPFAYDPKKSWQSALIHLAGPEGARALRPIGLLYDDYGWTDNIFTPLFTPGKQLHIAEIRNALDEFDEALVRLRSEEFEDNTYIQNILPELEPFAVSTREKFDEMMSDRFYRVDPEGFLVFQSSMEEIIAGQEPVVLDGNLSEWNAAEFRELYPQTDAEAGRVRAAFRFHSDTLYAAIRVDTDTLVVGNPDSWVGSDQILFIIEQTRNRQNTWIEPTDLMVLVRPPVQEEPIVLTGSFYLTPFSQRGISDITMRTISSFFSHFVGEVHPELSNTADGVRVAQRRTRTGYETEIAVPVSGWSETGIALSVNDARTTASGVRNTNFMLSRRPYIGNPHTYVPLVLD